MTYNREDEVRATRSGTCIVLFLFYRMRKNVFCAHSENLLASMLRNGRPNIRRAATEHAEKSQPVLGERPYPR